MPKKTPAKKEATPKSKARKAAVPKAALARRAKAKKVVSLSKAAGAVERPARPVRKKKTTARKNPAVIATKVRVRTMNHPRKPFFTASRVFWSAGILGGLAIVASALWNVASQPSAPTRSEQQRRIQLTQPTRSSNTNTTAVGAQPAAPFEDPSIRPSQALLGAFEEVSRLNLVAQRMAWWSRWIARDEAGALREIASLGSGPSTPDHAPLIPSGFDCTTFVETVMALARSERPQMFFQRLIEVRYENAQPGYFTRNHFPEADWVPNNIKARVLADITASIAGNAGFSLQTEKKEINKAKWFVQQKRLSERSGRSLASAGAVPAEWFKPQAVSLDYLPRAEVLAKAGMLPDGAIINFVRADDAKRPVLITHQGIVARERGKVLLRHVSPGGRLRTIALEDYLRRNAGFVGVTLNQVIDPAQGKN